jgi:hypothetical protein
MSETFTWTPAVGDEVVLVYHGIRSMISERSTIAKIGKRDIVLQNGKRFSARTMYESGRDYRGALLRSAHDPQVADIQRKQDIQRLRGNVRGAAETFWRDSNAATARALSVAALAYAEADA